MTNRTRLQALRLLAELQAALAKGQHDVWDDHDHQRATGALQGVLSTLGFEALHAHENHLSASRRAYTKLTQEED
jgi:hypothetical protein